MRPQPSSHLYPSHACPPVFAVQRRSCLWGMHRCIGTLYSGQVPEDCIASARTTRAAAPCVCPSAQPHHFTSTCTARTTNPLPPSACPKPQMVTVGHACTPVGHVTLCFAGVSGHVRQVSAGPRVLAVPTDRLAHGFEGLVRPRRAGGMIV